jgi:hypothetical protein
MTNITGANFNKANLIDVRLKRVDLSQALNLTPEQIESVEIDKATQLPAYLEITWKARITSKYKRPLKRKPNGKKQKNKSPSPIQDILIKKLEPLSVNFGLPQTQPHRFHPPHTLFLSGDNRLHNPLYIPDSIPTSPIK